MCSNARRVVCVARDNIRHQASSTADSGMVGAASPARAVRPLPVQIRVERARRSMLQIMVGNQRVRTLYVQCFCVFVSLAPSVAHQLSAGPAKKNDR